METRRRPAERINRRCLKGGSLSTERRSRIAGIFHGPAAARSALATGGGRKAGPSSSDSCRRATAAGGLPSRTIVTVGGRGRRGSSGLVGALHTEPRHRHHAGADIAFGLICLSSRARPCLDLVGPKDRRPRTG